MFDSGKLFLDCLILGSDVCICGTFVTLAFQLLKTNTAKGLSLQTLIIVVGARFLHLFSHYINLHFRPTVLPWLLYPSMDIVNACFGAMLLTCFCCKFYNSYEKDKDNFGINLFQKLFPSCEGPFLESLFLWLMIAALALAWHFIRQAPHSLEVSYFCCFYEAMGAVALFPQLWMFHKDGVVSQLLGNFVVLTALTRMCTLAFWISYPYLNNYQYPDNRGIQMCSEALNILILSDFLFYYIRAKIRGDKEIIVRKELSV